MRKVIYPGTFDPITNGHLDVIGRAADLFDEVIVALAMNSTKAPLFSELERIDLCKEAMKEVMPHSGHIRVDSFSGLLVDYAKKENAIAIIRGLRVLSDFEYEFQMALMNRKLEDITTVFVMPNEKYTYLNSTIIRELAKYGSDISGFVPECVNKKLKEKFSKK
ncbi:MAG: pantetheine-phosphate adenylyltransferase [Bacteroidota bacterium]|nr:pantetheine-phosphate adenylyltransferase [Bacteroidota bacterium]MDP4230964.1 pantetheine-phosphate adenylyltransferase [Bacteroidota bacterium]MDP4235169.1 pantetheine-phosphate adenylyltransferase [Bacteroidota bacterium]